MRLFALEGAAALGASVAVAVGRPVDPHEERAFEDGEHKARPLVSVRGEEVFVLAGLAGDGDASPNDRLIRLLFFLAACRENGAARVTAVVPYLAYARKDRQTKRRDPVTMRYVAQLFEAMGTNRVVALDVHNVVAFQNAFRCETVHLEARQLFAARLTSMAAGRPVCVFSPDGGGVKRAELLRRSYEAATGEGARFGFMEKHRSRGVVSGSLFAGEVEGATVFVVDDMIGTGGTMVRAARACRERGAAAVVAMATHGLFGPGSGALMEESAIDRILVTDSVPSAAVAAGDRVEIVPVGPLIGEVIGRLHAGEPLGDLTGLED
jgi:ribose-phosphate pyrophosphokinase